MTPTKFPTISLPLTFIMTKATKGNTPMGIKTPLLIQREKNLNNKDKLTVEEKRDSSANKETEI